MAGFPSGLGMQNVYKIQGGASSEESQEIAAPAILARDNPDIHTLRLWKICGLFGILNTYFSPHESKVFDAVLRV